jgi:hypothetical protein
MRVDWHEHCPTQTRNSGRAAPATKYFSGNGIAVAAMCADSHQYRPPIGDEGGLTGKVDISLEMAPVAHLWLTQSSTVKTAHPHKGVQGLILYLSWRTDSNR